MKNFARFLLLTFALPAAAAGWTLRSEVPISGAPSHSIGKSGKMMKTFATLLLLTLTIPAAAAPFVLRAEMPLSEPEYGISSNSLGDAHIASNGDGYLAVWTDYRTNGQPSVYAARIAADGTVLDRLGLRVAEYAHAGPVIWTGSKFLIAYDVEPSGSTVVVTMTPDGVFGEPVPIGQYSRFGAMATNGTNVLIVLSQEALLLDLEGHKLRSVPLLASPGGGYYQPRVAAAGSTYLIASALPDVIVQRVESDGGTYAPKELADRGVYGRVGLASDGSHFLVIWEQQKKLQMQFVTGDGTPTGAVQTLTTTANADYPSVAWRDGEYLLLFSDTVLSEVYGMRVASNGTAASEPKKIKHGIDPDVEIATRGRDGIAMLDQIKAGVFDDASVGANEPLRRIVDVAVTARPQSNVHLARLGNGYVAAWEERDGIFVSTAAGMTPVNVLGSDDKLIDVVVDESDVIWVLWGEDNHVALTRFTSTLHPIDPLPIYIDTEGPVQPTAAAGDGVIALAYEVADEDDSNETDIVALLLHDTGSGVTRTDVPLTTWTFADFGAAVAFDGSAFVYGWFHELGKRPLGAGNWPKAEIVGARVAPDGTLLDTRPVFINSQQDFSYNLHAARGANGVAFAWQSSQGIQVALFRGTVNDFGASMPLLGALTPHNDGFLLVRANTDLSPAPITAEYLVLNADLSLNATGTLPSYIVDTYWKLFDIDVIGGPAPVFGYARSANEGLYGHVSRVFVRRAGEGPPRRRVVR